MTNTSSTKNYFLLSEMFYPDEISTGYVMTEIASKLSEEINIDVICGPANYESDVFVSKKGLNNRIKILRVSIPHFNKNKIVGRFFRMGALTLKMGFELFKRVKKGDTVIIVTNPAPLLISVALLKKILSFDLIIIVHDVFPENACSAGILKETSLIFKVLKKIFDFSYNSADKLITVGEDMKKLIESKTSNSKISVIPNWADSNEVIPDENDRLSIVSSGALRGKIIIQFAGNIGRVQALDVFVRAFEKANNSNLVLMIIGAGALKGTLEKYIVEKSLSNVLILDPLHRQYQNTFLNSCHIGLVSLSKGMFGLGVPSKSYNIMSAGKPILFVGDKGSEVSNYIIQNNVGWAFDWDSEQSLVDFLARLCVQDIAEFEYRGKNARALVESKFTKEIILNAYKREILKNGS